MNYQEKYKLWCTDEYFDEKTRRELQALEGDSSEIEDRFYKDLEFGTGGLRGVLGAGSNRMNVYTVRKATQGLANFILKNAGNRAKKVAIAYDSRIMSEEFAEEAALCLNANGIETYRFAGLRPTPELSFAVRQLGCIAGIVITASHNPREYTGYKVYWSDGGQITTPLDKEIIREVNAIQEYSYAKSMKQEEAAAKGLYHLIDEEMDYLYISELKKLVLNPEITRSEGKELKIVYTPLHGTGNMLVRRILKEIGFEHVFVVPEQEKPDGNFPTVAYPNPEDPNAFELALKYAKEQQADIVMATDPDADRLGIYARTESGEYAAFTGNMSGALICEYILSQKKTKGALPSNGAIVSTIVTSDMVKAAADYYGMHFVETLTGFKFIGEQIKQFEEQGSYQYLFGMEESYGCLPGTYARDKDAVAAVMMLSEAAAFYKNQGRNLWDQMLQIYKKYGFYKEALETMTFKGKEGAARIQTLVEKFRENPPEQMADFEVLRIRDYNRSIISDRLSGEKEETCLPKSNVLYFELSRGAWFCVRPSGTEPKIKYYFGVIGQSMEQAEEELKKLRDAVINF